MSKCYFMPMNDDELLSEAMKASRRAQAKFSGLSVGAAVLTEDGKIYQGANIESSSYGLTICAERLAIFKAVMDGHTNLKAVAVYADTEDKIRPCGACLQIMNEWFNREAPVICGNGRVIEKFSLHQLIPYPFVHI